MEAYDRVTGGRLLSGRTLEWVTDLVTRYGDEATAGAIEAEASGRHFEKILGRARDRLAGDAVRSRSGPSGMLPRTITGAEFLAWVRGETAEPARPYVCDTRDLSPHEYDEVVRWTGERRAEASAS